MKSMVNPHAHGEVPHPHFYNFALRTAVPALTRLYGPLHYTGEETLREMEGPYILAPTHRSMLDPFAVARVAFEAAGTQVHFMAKQQLWQIPLLGRVIEAGGGFKVDREATGVQSDLIDNVAAIVKRGGILGIFPEGTRREGLTVERRTLHRGVGLFALAHGLPIVPVGVAGTEKGHRRPIAVAIGEPLPVEQTEVDLERPKGVLRRVRAINDDLHRRLQQAHTTAHTLQRIRR